MAKFEMNLNEMEKLVECYTNIQLELEEASKLMNEVTGIVKDGFMQGTTKDTLFGESAGLLRYSAKVGDYAATMKALTEYTKFALKAQIDMDKLNAKRVFEGIPTSNMEQEIKQWVEENPKEASQKIYENVKKQREGKK